MTIVLKVLLDTNLFSLFVKVFNYFYDRKRRTLEEDGEKLEKNQDMYILTKFKGNIMKLKI